MFYVSLLYRRIASNQKCYNEFDPSKYLLTFAPPKILRIYQKESPIDLFRVHAKQQLIPLDPNQLLLALLSPKSSRFDYNKNVIEKKVEKLYVYEPDLTSLEEECLLDAFRSGWVSSKGKYIELFENSFSEFVGSSNSGVCVSNGTVAIHLALLALGVGKSDEVLVPDFTYIACANAVTYTGATAVFFDSQISDLQPHVISAKEMITEKTKAIVLPHLYAANADVKAFRNLCDENGIYLVEDCSEAIGSTIEGLHVGVLGDISTFSFYGNKTLTTGEGGMIISENMDYLNNIRKLKSQGQKFPGSFFHDVLGYNYRMTNLQAAIGFAQVKRASEILEAKKRIHQAYKNQLSKLSSVRLLESQIGYSGNWMETIILDSFLDSELIRNELSLRGIETRPGFTPITLMPMYDKNKTNATNIKSVWSSVVNLPSSPRLTEVQVEFIVQTLADILK